jgi:hypothetical protein
MCSPSRVVIILLVVLYVDNMWLIRMNKEIIRDFKAQFSSKFDVKYVGARKFILGMEIKRDCTNMKL